MTRIIEEALRLSKLGYSVIPTDGKNPAIYSWKGYQKRPMFLNEVRANFTEETKGIALLMGGKFNLTTIDLDIKYALTEDFYDKVVSTIPESIFKKLKIARTKSGGYHWIFSCPKIEGNLKLANRPTTDQEVMQTFSQEYLKSGNLRAAMKIAANDKVRVLCETRGAGGYILIAPSPGYEWLDENKIHKLTEVEYDILFDCLRTFNEYIPPVKNTERTKIVEEESPFIDFNKNGDGLQLLIDHGWTILQNRGKDARLLRPGQVHSHSSALYDNDTKIFNVFTTSTSFEPGKGYTNTDLLMELEDLTANECLNRLKSMGYGRNNI